MHAYFAKHKMKDEYKNSALTHFLTDYNETNIVKLDYNFRL